MNYFKMLLLVVISLFVSCSEDGKKSSTLDVNASNEIIARGSVYGRVVDSTGSGLPSVAVTLYNDSLKEGGFNTNSDENGYFKIPDVLNGIYKITYTKENYSIYSTKITINIDEDIENIDEVTLKYIFKMGSIKGYLVNSSGTIPISGEQVKAGSITSFSDSTGCFIITGLKEGYHQVSLGGSVYGTKVVDSIYVKANEETLIGINMLTEDMNLVERDIYGEIVDSLSSTSEVDKIIVTLTGDNIESENPKIYELSWVESTKKFSGFVYIPSEGNSWVATVKVYDVSGKKTGQQSVNVSNSTGDVSIPKFWNFNAKPTVKREFGYRTTINSETEFLLIAKDDFDGSLSSYKIDYTNDGIWDDENDILGVDTYTITTKHTYTDYGTFTYAVFVTDEDGNSTTCIDTIDVTPVISTNMIGGSGNDGITKVLQTNNGYVLFGNTSSNDNGFSSKSGEFYILDVDKDGNRNFIKYYDFGDDTQLIDAVISQSLGYYLAFKIKENVNNYQSAKYGGYDVWIVHIDIDGNITWETTIGSKGADDTKRIYATSDGGCTVIFRGGEATGLITNHNGGGDLYFAHLLSDGSIDWINNFGGPDSEFYQSSAITKNGSYVLMYSLRSVTFSFEDIYLFSTFDEDANIVSTDTIPSYTIRPASKIIEQTDGSFTIGTYYQSDKTTSTAFPYGSFDLAIYNLTVGSGINWSYTYGSGNHEPFNDMIQTSSGDYILLGTVDTATFDVSTSYRKKDIWMIKCNSSGELLEQITIGGSMDDYAHSIFESENDTYTLFGRTYSTDYDMIERNGESDIYMMKTFDLEL